MYLHQTGKKAVFQKLTEETVEDSTLIPKVNPSKDFKQYLRLLSDSNIEEYITNHPYQPAVEDPFSTAKDAEIKLSNSMDAVALTLRTSSCSRRSATSDLRTLPPTFFNRDFRLPS